MVVVRSSCGGIKGMTFGKVVGGVPHKCIGRRHVAHVKPGTRAVGPNIGVARQGHGGVWIVVIIIFQIIIQVGGWSVCTRIDNGMPRGQLSQVEGGIEVGDVNSELWTVTILVLVGRSMIRCKIIPRQRHSASYFGGAAVHGLPRGTRVSFVQCQGLR